MTEMQEPVDMLHAMCLSAKRKINDAFDTLKARADEREAIFRSKMNHPSNWQRTDQVR